MRPLALGLIVGLTLLLCLLPSIGQPPQGRPTVKLPVTKVVLYNAGIGYFHRSGSINGPTSIELKADREDINDLLKTLLAEDANGTLPRSVTFDHHAPTDIALRAFALDLAVNPSIGHLLHQARGEKITIADKEGQNVSGLIVSVEKPTPDVVATTGHSPDGDVLVKSTVLPLPADAAERVNVLSDEGLQSIPLKSIKKLKFLRAELEAEFRKALETLASSRMEGKKSVVVEFTGAGKRDVKVGYVAEAPLWKPSYRLSLAENAGRIQAWATVENATDEDWTDVAVTLASGRPMTFQMDLYEPLYLPRPFVEPDTFASLRPPLYSLGQFGQQGNLGGAFGIGGFGGGIGGGKEQAQRILPPGGQNLGFGGGAFGIQGGQSGIPGSPYFVRPGIRSLIGERLSYDEFVQRMQNKARVKTATHAGIGGGLFSAANELSLGEPAEYRIAEPVSLPRFKTALLPFHAGPVPFERVSIYNAQSLATYPLLGLKLTNTTGHFLPGGSIAVYDEGSFAGEARLPDLRIGQTRLVSFAIDLLTTVQRTELEVEKIRDDVIVKEGWLRLTDERKFTQKYILRTRANTAKTILIEHPAEPGRTLLTPDKASERTKDAYRFSVAVKPGETATFSVVERASFESSEDLSNLTDAVLATAREKSQRPAVKAYLDRLAALRGELESMKKSIAFEQNRLKEIEADQSRLRANIERVPRDSDAYKRYLKKFDEQETEIETLRMKSKELTAAVETKTAELAAYVKRANAN